MRPQMPPRPAEKPEEPHAVSSASPQEIQPSNRDDIDLDTASGLPVGPLERVYNTMKGGLLAPFEDHAHSTESWRKFLYDMRGCFVRVCAAVSAFEVLANGARTAFALGNTLQGALQGNPSLTEKGVLGTAICGALTYGFYRLSGYCVKSVRSWEEPEGGEQQGE